MTLTDEPVATRPPSSNQRPPDSHGKALSMNLDASTYGTFAEIGAGQEVARWFLTVGAASGTVAQTISAYDKTFSDSEYGRGTRYVSRERLLAMLDHEYRLLLERLNETRGQRTRFFVFADTIAARNYLGDNQQHGWLGMRFQSETQAEPSDILLHANLLDPTAPLQQEAVGVLGVNLIYAAFNARATAEQLVDCLKEELTSQRMEIDVMELSGPAFRDADPRCWSLELLRRGMAHAIVFDRSGRPTEAAGLLRKRPLIVDRGRFETVEPFHKDMLIAAERQLRTEAVPLRSDPAGVFEMSIHPADIEPDPSLQAPDNAELLRRVDQLTAVAPVIVSDFAETYQLAGYLRRHTSEPVRFVLGVSLLAKMLEDRFYEHLSGRLLEGLGKLLSQNVKVYVYPMPADAVRAALPDHGEKLRISGEGDGVATADDLHPFPPLDHLYRYLRGAGWVVPLSPP